MKPLGDRRHFALAIVVILIGVVGRAIIDSLVMRSAGAEGLGALSQLASMMTMIGDVSLAGIGVALISESARRPMINGPGLLRGAMFACLALSGLATLVVVPIYLLVVELPAPYRSEVPFAGLAGWMSLSTGMLATFLTATRRYRGAIAWSVGSAFPPVLMILLAPTPSPIRDVLIGFGVSGLAAVVGILIWTRRCLDADLSWLWRFAPSGIAIGFLSPLSMVLARSEIALHADWGVVAQATALWRVNEITVALAFGVLSLQWLPAFSVAAPAGTLWTAVRAAAMHVVLPAAIATLAIACAVPWIVDLLYRGQLEISMAAAVPLLAGDFLRIVSWLFLFGLYASGKARAVLIGEFMSVPLFAALVYLTAPLTIEGIGIAWSAAFLAYAAFNAIAMRPPHCSGVSGWTGRGASGRPSAMLDEVPTQSSRRR